MIVLELAADTALQYFARMGALARDLTKPISEVLADALSDAYTEVTASKGGLYGAPWTPMKHFTVWFHKRDPSTLLDATGALAASLVRGGAGNIFEAGPTAGVAGTADRKAGWQQRGTQRTFLILQFLRTGARGKLGVPKGFSEWFIYPGILPRPFLLWHVENFEKYAQIFRAHMMGTDAAV